MLYSFVRASELPDLLLRVNCQHLTSVRHIHHKYAGSRANSIKRGYAIDSPLGFSAALREGQDVRVFQFGAAAQITSYLLHNTVQQALSEHRFDPIIAENASAAHCIFPQ